MIMGWLRALVLCASLLCGPAFAASYNVTPATIASTLLKVVPGDLITLSPGAYGTVKLPAKNWSPAIKITATGATLTLITNKASGVSILGGTYVSATGPTSGYALTITGSRTLDFTDIYMTSTLRGAVLSNSHYITFTNPRASFLKSDGLDIGGGSTHIIVDGMVCENFQPVFPDHPDCIQGWSRPGQIVSDVIITHTKVNTVSQGVFFGNHIADRTNDGIVNPVDDGGFDRISIVDNDIIGGAPQGIVCGSCRNSLIRDNRVSTLPSAQYQTRITISATAGFTNKVCNNSVAAGGNPLKKAIAPTPCK